MFSKVVAPTPLVFGSPIGTEYPRCSTPPPKRAGRKMLNIDLDDDESVDLFDDSPSWIAFKNAPLSPLPSRVLPPRPSRLVALADDTIELEPIDPDESNIFDESPSFIAMKSAPFSWPSRPAPLPSRADDTFELEPIGEDESNIFDESPSFIAMKSAPFSWPSRPSPSPCRADETFELSQWAPEDEENLFEDSPSFVLFRSCPNEDNEADLSWLKAPPRSTQADLKVVDAALEGDASPLVERPLAAHEDETKPKMQRLMAFWKAMERRER